MILNNRQRLYLHVWDSPRTVAVGMFYRQIIMHDGIPFVIHVKSDQVG